MECWKDARRRVLWGDVMALVLSFACYVSHQHHVYLGIMEIFMPYHSIPYFAHYQASITKGYQNSYRAKF
jgi:hypothetical protein